MSRASATTAAGDAVIETTIDGAGPALVILPSYGRDGGADYDDIAARVAGAGWRVLRPQPRGVGRSAGPMAGLTMHDLAADVATVIRALADGPAVLLGHAFGNMLARLVATDHPDLVRAVILAAAEASEVPDDVKQTPFIAGDPERPEEERLAALRKAFFAPGHDPRAWLSGWHPRTLAMQRAAAAAVPFSRYRACGAVPILEIIPADDPFKPRRSWPELGQQLPGRVRSVVIQHAAHALFPEQPSDVGDAVLQVLAGWGGT